MITIFRGRKAQTRKEKICLLDCENNQIFFIEENNVITFLADNFCDELEDISVNTDELSKEILSSNDAVFLGKLENFQLDNIINQAKKIIF